MRILAELTEAIARSEQQAARSPGVLFIHGPPPWQTTRELPGKWPTSGYKDLP